MAYYFRRSAALNLKLKQPTASRIIANGVWGGNVCGRRRARERFPPVEMPMTRLNPWDVGIRFPFLVETYNMTVLMWFRPMRPKEFQGAEQLT